MHPWVSSLTLPEVKQAKNHHLLHLFPNSPPPPSSFLILFLSESTQTLTEGREKEPNHTFPGVARSPLTIRTPGSKQPTLSTHDVLGGGGGGYNKGEARGKGKL